MGFRCNNACRFCDQGDEKEQSFSRSELAELLSGTEGENERLVISGGEATLDPNLLEWLVGEAKAKGYRTVEVFTNGRMLAYGKVVDTLKNAGVDRFHVSLHASNPRIHDWLTRVPGSFEQTVTGIRKAVREGVPVEVHSVLLRENYRDCPSMVSLLKKLNVKHFHLRCVVPDGWSGDAKRFPNLVPKYTLIRPYIDMTRKRCDQAGMKITIHDMPLCVSGRNAEHVVADRSQWIGLDTITWPRCETSFPDLCEGCEVRTKCKGIPLPYLDYYGSLEFQPIVTSAILTQ
jgi:MoaA/NifB/PqqE/SkfB family radical SAM enzyme